MAEVDKEKLRRLAQACVAAHEAHLRSDSEAAYDAWAHLDDEFNANVTPEAVLSLLDENAALAARIAELQRQIGEYRDALQFAARSLATVTSSDGSGHADLALIALKMAGVQEDERASLVEKWKAGAQWRIDKARAGAPALTGSHTFARSAACRSWS